MKSQLASPTFSAVYAGACAPWGPWGDQARAGPAGCVCGSAGVLATDSPPGQPGAQVAGRGGVGRAEGLVHAALTLQRRPRADGVCAAHVRVCVCTWPRSAGGGGQHQVPRAGRAAAAPPGAAVHALVQAQRQARVHRRLALPGTPHQPGRGARGAAGPGRGAHLLTPPPVHRCARTTHAVLLVAMAHRGVRGGGARAASARELRRCWPSRCSF